MGPAEVQKKLSRNDLGLTGSHQAGIVVPKQADILAFFPALNESTMNPRETMTVRCLVSGDLLKLSFIHYNGRLHRLSTRDEYRLTGLTRYLRRRDALDGDTLRLSRGAAGYSIDVIGLALSQKEHDSSVALTSLWKASY